jgi:hypothetical protein
MLHLTILLSPSNATLKPECDEIASVLKGPDVDARVYEAPVTYRPDSDFWLVFANDLSSHEEALRATPDARIDVARFVVLRPPHDHAADIAETHRVAAVVDYDAVAAWRADSRRGLIVRTEIASELPGELGRAVQSEHYASWWPGPDQPLSSQLVTYLRTFLERSPRDLTLVRAEDARQRGFAPVTIRVDARAAGLIPTLFPAGEIIINLSGPPGGVVAVAVASVKDASAALRDMIPASLQGWWSAAIEIGAEDRARISGEDRTGLMFYTGAGFGRVGWFGCVVSRPAGAVLVAIGVSARSGKPITVADIVANPSIASALATLDIA